MTDPKKMQAVRALADAVSSPIAEPAGESVLISADAAKDLNAAIEELEADESMLPDLLRSIAVSGLAPGSEHREDDARTLQRAAAILESLGRPREPEDHSPLRWEYPAGGHGEGQFQADASEWRRANEADRDRGTGAIGLLLDTATLKTIEAIPGACYEWDPVKGWVGYSGDSAETGT